MRKDLVSALRTSPIIDFARFRASFRNQTQSIIRTLDHCPALGYAHGLCDKFALVIESVKAVSPHGGFDIFHPLVGIVGASWSHNLCEMSQRSQRSHHRDCESCPARILSQQLLDIIADAIENKKDYFQLCFEPASHSSNGGPSGCESSWNFLLAWKTMLQDFKKLLPVHQSYCYRDVDDAPAQVVQ